MWYATITWENGNITQGEFSSLSQAGDQLDLDNNHGDENGNKGIIKIVFTFDVNGRPEW
jgi:hypothetical protein